MCSKNPTSRFSLFVIVILSVTFQISKCDVIAEQRTDQEPEDIVNAAYEYYKNLYLTTYGEPSQLQPAPPKKGALFNRQDLQNMFDPENALTLALIASGLGAIGAIGVFVNANSINSLSNDQDSICSTAKALGNLSLATENTSTATAALNQAALNAAIALINGIGTPSC
jgi:hypothetical protein